MARFTSVSLMQVIRPDIGSLSTVTSTALGVVIAQAEAAVLAAVSGRYSLAASGSYPLLEGVATDLAIYRLFSRRQYVTMDAKQKSGIESLRTEAEATLQALMAGQIELVDSSGAVVAPDASGLISSTTQTYVPTFSELPIDEAGHDPDKLDDERDRRDLDGVRRWLA